jgi:hypothetical protein
MTAPVPVVEARVPPEMKPSYLDFESFDEFMRS